MDYEIPTGKNWFPLTDNDFITYPVGQRTSAAPYFASMAWIALLLAAACQTAWTYSLKYADFNALLHLRITPPVLIPVLINIASGLANVFFLNMAFRYVPLATAFGIWTAGTLVFIKLADVLILKAPWSFAELFFVGLLTVAIIGLKLSEPK
ncbi:DMT family transporter [Fibrella arboris]|uniref:DMT family transporter n=1 Tax=Fibrella arboris TaxID=3242486 RepID=UPI003520EF70